VCWARKAGKTGATRVVKQQNHAALGLRTRNRRPIFSPRSLNRGTRERKTGPGKEIARTERSNREQGGTAETLPELLTRLEHAPWPIQQADEPADRVELPGQPNPLMNKTMEPTNTTRNVNQGVRRPGRLEEGRFNELNAYGMIESTVEALIPSLQWSGSPDQNSQGL